MCGLSGLISQNEYAVNKIFDSMKAIKHRGPDDTLIFEGDNKKFYSSELSNDFSKQNFCDIASAPNSKTFFGFNRLSIVDLSNHGMQPFYDAENQLLFMLNGEIYNYQILKNTLLSETIFFSQSDAEVGMKLYQKMGDDFVQHLQGMFAIAIFDFKKKELKLFRDRLGIKPLYYFQHNDIFAFSSEIQGILEMNVVEKKLNHQALAYSMFLGTAPFPLTLYNDIFSLPPGHQLTFTSTNTCKIEPYWKIPLSANQDTSSEFFNEQVENLAKLYQASEVKSAISISGGLDSGTLAYLIGKIHPNFDAIHITDPEKWELNETQLNALNAKLSLHYEIFDEQIPLIEQSVLIEEEPNFLMETTWIISDFAKRKGYKVVFNALGPDEIFGGYNYFRKAFVLSNFFPLLTMTPQICIPKKWKNKTNELKEFGLHHLGFLTRKGFEWEEIKQIFEKNNWEFPKIHPLHFLEKQINDNYSTFKSLPLLKKMAFLDIYYYISSHHAVRNEKPSMYCSIETRYPFLDHQFIEHYLNQNNIYRGIFWNQKPFFKKNIQSWLHPEVFKMKKKGFTVQKQWSKTNAKDFYIKMLQKLFSLNKVKM